MLRCFFVHSTSIRFFLCSVCEMMYPEAESNLGSGGCSGHENPLHRQEQHGQRRRTRLCYFGLTAATCWASGFFC